MRWNRGRPRSTRPPGSSLPAAGAMAVLALALLATPARGQLLGDLFGEPPPEAPEDFEARAVSPTRVDLSWEAVEEAEEGVQHYNLYRDGERIAQVEGTTHSDRGLEPDETYEYAVAAVDGKDREGDRAHATATTPEEDDEDDDDGDDGDDGDDSDTSPPGRPGSLTASAEGPTTVDLRWTAAEDPQSGIDGYRVYRDDEAVAFVSDTRYSDTGLETDTRYVYRVSAVNGEGLEGPKTPEVGVRTEPAEDDVPPAPPTGLRIEG